MKVAGWAAEHLAAAGVCGDRVAEEVLAHARMVKGQVRGLLSVAVL